MNDRKAELERKKAKLQELRKEKERRRIAREKKEREDAESEKGKPPKDEKTAVDEVLSSMGIAPLSALDNVVSTNSSLTSQPASDQSATASPDNSLLQAPSPPRPQLSKKKQVSLSVISVQQTNIPPKEQVTYEKQTQTQSLSGVDRTAHGFDYYVITYDDLGDEDDSLTVLDNQHVYQSKLPPGVLHPGMPMVVDVKPAVTPVEKEKKEEEKKPEVREISEEEKQMLVLSDDFQKFFDRTTRVVERALCENADIFLDYTGASENDKDGEDRGKMHLSMSRCFYDERWSRHRVVTCMDWSSQHPELLVASYNNNEDSPHEPDGVALIWNVRYKKDTPEYIFHCQSPVMSATFARFHPNLILGGTYSGQIVLWDNRVQKRTPVQRSPLSASAHTHPVYCLKVVGTQNAHNLISVSTDGRLCSWSLDMLSQPQEALELQHSNKSRNVAVTAMAFPQGDVNNFVLGSEEGTVYTACRHGSRAGVLEHYEGHQGPVTGVHTNVASGHVDFSHLFITSSFDWTVKLWSLKEHKPLYSFENYSDYVYDVAWSPTHPALFAAVDGSGQLDLWNINHDTEIPLATEVVDGCPALNRVSWTQNGQQVTVGDDSGHVWIYDVAEPLSQPRGDEWSRLVYTLTELKNNQAEEENEKHSMYMTSSFR